MQRAFRRAGLPIWYTEGFNPHAYIMFALALSLGYESRCEVMDFKLTENIPFDEIRERLNKSLPSGLEIIKVSAPVKSHKDICSAEFEINMFCDNPHRLESEFLEFISQDKITVLKRNKKKQMIETDLKPFTQILSVISDDKKATVTLKLPAGTQQNFNPSLITDAFCNISSQKINLLKIERKKIICSDGKDFL
jgi:radical SAM-linked protein